MTALETLQALGRGERPSEDRLPPSIRLEAGGALLYGEEAIVQHFRAAPFTFDEAATVVRSAGQLAILTPAEAVVADLSGELVRRLWRLGDVAPAREPALAVAFDPDLRQTRGDLAFRAEDHLELSADAVDGVLAAGRALAREVDAGEAAAYRARAFAIRAFGDGEAAAALFAVYRMSGEAERRGGFAYAAVTIVRGLTRVVRDRAGEAAVAGAAWRPAF